MKTERQIVTRDGKVLFTAMTETSAACWAEFLHSRRLIAPDAAAIFRQAGHRCRRPKAPLKRAPARTFTLIDMLYLNREMCKKLAAESKTLAADIVEHGAGATDMCVAKIVRQIGGYSTVCRSAATRVQVRRLLPNEQVEAA